MGTIWSAFLIGGIICVIGQLVLEYTSATPAHLLSGLVVGGAILGGLGLYQPIINFAGAGATVPVSSFGNAIVTGAMSEANNDGFIGLLAGIFKITSAGISATIIFGFLTAVVFKPKG